MAEANSTVTYRDIPGHPGYRVGDDGSVWSRLIWAVIPGIVGGRRIIGGTWHRLVPDRLRGGYLRVALTGRKRWLVHHLVLEAFVGPCPEGMECCHGDGDRANNRLGNLRWGTKLANAADRIQHGTHPSGERNGNARLTEDDVRSIRASHARGGITFKRLAKQYHVSDRLISGIVARRWWPRVV